MPEENLWGDLQLDAPSQMPAGILEEQAAVLARLTNDLLEGRVTERQVRDATVAELAVVAPLLEGYTYRLLAIRHDVRLYPLEFHDHVRETERRCRTEAEFKAALRDLLSSVDVRRLVQSLVTQSLEDAGPPA